MGAQLLQLMSDVFIDVLEGVKKSGSDGLGPGAVLDLGTQIALGGVHQPTIGVVDDHKFLAAEQIMRNDQGAQRVVGDDAAGIADDVGVSLLQAQSARRKPRVHAGQDGELALRTRSQPAQFMGARVDFVCGENFINDAHGLHSLAKLSRISGWRSAREGFMRPKRSNALQKPALTNHAGNTYNYGLRLALGGPMYAVIQTGGKQYRVAPGDTIRIERVEGKVGEKVNFGSVLAVHTDDKKIVLGADAGKASVSGKIVSQGRGKKLTVLKFKKGNQYKISRGHRQNFTAVQVSDIKL